MKIYDRDITGNSPAEPGRAQETQKAGRGSPHSVTAGNAGGDRVELSSAMARLSRAISAMGDDRASKVHALTQQYQSGNYQPDSLAISRGLIQEALSDKVA
jgi:flagellar biosynthesis anti-sigma factor FlgM